MRSSRRDNSRKRRRMPNTVGAVTAFASAILIAVTSTAPAHAADDTDVQLAPVQYLIPVSKLPEDVRTGAPPAAYQSIETVPNGVSAALVRLEHERPDLEISGSKWNAESGMISLFAAGDRAHVESALKLYGLAGSVEFQEVERGYAEIRDLIHEIIGEDGVLPSGQSVVMAIPELDGSVIRLVLDEKSKSGRMPLAIPDVGVDIRVEYGPAVEAATRNVAASGGTYRYSGAYMQNGLQACSTGWRISKISNGDAGMASANHCDNTIGKQWWYSSLTDYTIGQFQGTNPPPSMSGLPDLAIWSGSGTAQLLPAVFVGDHTVAGSNLYANYGVMASTLDTHMCYSGSRSGTVCNNKITNVNVTACYTGLSFCYDRLAITEQISGIPAAGNGDSGGPVYGTSSGIYASGIISGISNASTNCTGDPSTANRKCSARVLYAPLTDVFDLGYGVNYYTAP